MKLNRSVFPVLLLTLAAVAPAADFFSDFESANTADPFGLKLGYYSSTLTNYTAFSTYQSVAPDGLSRWYDPSNEVFLVPAAFKNTTGNTVHGIAPGEAALHGGQAGEIAAASYTLQNGGNYRLSALFGAGDSSASGPYGNVDVYVRINGTTVFSSLNTATSQSYMSSMFLAAGSQVEFLVGIGNDTYFNDSTPLSANISSVPGPGALAVFGLGMVGKLRRRRTAK